MFCIKQYYFVISYLIVMRMFLSTFGLVSIIVASSIVFIGLVFVIYKFVIEKNNMRRQIAELDRRFEYLHALLIGQDAQYVRRLEIIARTNLIYIEIHTKFLKKFKEVRDKHDAKAQSTINHLKDLRDEKGLNAKRLKEEIIDAKALIDAFDREVNDLNSELLSVVKPEEDCRQISLTHKERFRRIKQEYFAKQNNLSLVSESFEQTFGLIDSLFDQFDKLVESANYDDANLMLPKIDKILDEISNDMQWASAIVLGCGMGVSDDTRKITEFVLKNSKVPVILDADGINCITLSIDILKDVKVPVVLTPHPGEMSRLVSKSVEEVQSNRVEVAKDFAKKYGVLIALKGANTVVTDGETVFVNMSGNPAMAMGGTGDMLSGIIGSFVAQGINPYDATKAGVFIHGLSGDNVSKAISQRGITVFDMIDRLGALMSEF